MGKFILILIGTWFVYAPLTAQDNLKKVEGSGIHTSDEVYVNEKGEYFSKIFYITFEKHVTENIFQAKGIQSSNIRSEFDTLKDIFTELEKNYGLLKMERVHPEAAPNDTIRYSKRGKRVVVSDLSKRYKLVFDEIQPYEKVKNLLKSENIRYIEPPEIIFATSDYPNDPYFDNQWTHKILESQKVFDITDGSEDIIIGISDFWTSNSTHGVHEELQGKIPAYQTGKWVPGGGGNYSHGPRIALIAAAKNNNGKGISSLGGNFQVIPASTGSFGLEYLRDLPLNLIPDVINMSWTGNYSQFVKEDIKDLLSMGVVMVGASVNTLNRTNDFGNPILWPGQTTWGEPFAPYPASFYYPDSVFQVISTTATQLTDATWHFDPLEPPIDPFQYEERFRFENYGTQDEWFFNYGLSNNPVANPSAAFTDVAAPAGWIFTARGEYATETGSQNEYRAGGGATSEAAPLVTSVVGMMLSVNPNLGVREVYDIITSTTDYDNIVVPPGTSTFYHPDGIRKYNKYIGYGRVNAYKAVLASVPKITSDVTSNTIWSGYVHLENTISVDNNATLTVLPGTTVLLNDNVYFNIKPGSKIIAEGTEEKPIRFVRLDPTKQWNRVALLSSAGNSFKWALFDGGYINLSIASKNNVIEHSTFRNAAFRNIEGWHNQDGTGNASAAISYSLIENSATVGLVGQYLDMSISYTTIRDNTQSGLYINTSNVHTFHHNIVTGNGGSTRDGIEVTVSGALWMQKQLYEDGFNEVYDNGDDQISSSGDLLIGTSPSPGLRNSIYGNYSGNKYLVENNGGLVNAYRAWWGQASPVSSMFGGSGTIIRQNPLSANPLSGVPHGHGGQSPAKALPDGSISSPNLAEAYEQAEYLLERAGTLTEIRDKLYELYFIAGLSENGELKERFNTFARARAQDVWSFYDSQEKNSTLINYARVLYVKSLIRDEQYDSAKAWIAQAGLESFTGHDKRDWLHLKAVVYTYHGQYEQALQSLQEYYAFQQSQGADMEEVRADYEPFEADILARLNSGDGEMIVEPNKSQETFSKAHFGLTSYPNPFNPVTNIVFTLPAKSQVSLTVYDMLGREVAVLVHGELPAGEQTIRFDASNLANGIYLYKLRVNNQELVQKMTLIK